MTPLFHPQLVNGDFGDPVVYIDCLFARRALMFDLGETHALPPRKLLRLSDIFVSHTHMDHFMGFDYLLRVCLGRARTLRLFGPPGFVEQVGHKLAAYTWNLVDSYETDFTMVAIEADLAAHRLRGADWLFIETVFLEEDAGQAADKYHLTTTQAARIARRAKAQRFVPMHFSARYMNEPDRARAEAEAAFASGAQRETIP